MIIASMLKVSKMAIYRRAWEPDFPGLFMPDVSKSADTR